MTTVETLCALGCAPELAVELIQLGGIGSGGSATVTAAGTTQGTATVLADGLSVITSSTFNTSDGASIPGGGAIGQSWTVVNATTEPVKLYPPDGGQFSGRNFNSAIFLRGGSSAQITKGSATAFYAIGDEISNAREHWVHTSTLIAASTNYNSVYSTTVQPQQGVCISGTFRGAYVGKTTIAAAFEGTFLGSASRNATGGTTIGNVLGSFQDGVSADATLLVDSDNSTLLVDAHSISLAAGTFRQSSSFASVAAAPIARVDVDGNDIRVVVKGVAVDTIRMQCSIRVTQFTGQ
jgi:hypothetical protein